MRRHTPRDALSYIDDDDVSCHANADSMELQCFMCQLSPLILFKNSISHSSCGAVDDWLDARDTTPDGIEEGMRFGNVVSNVVGEKTGDKISLVVSGDFTV